MVFWFLAVAAVFYIFSVELRKCNGGGYCKRDALVGRSKENIYIIGGTRAVNSNVEKRLRKYGKVTRVFGANRFETSLNVAREFFEDADNAVVSYSHNFPDGLCGGTLANALGSPVLLGRTNDTILVKPFFTENAILKTTVLGGERLIDNNSVLKLFDTIIKPTIKVNK